MSNTPSDAEILALAQQHLKAFAQFSLGEVWFEGEVEFARAVLAKWGTPQPSDCTRSHPHEDMSDYCLLRTEIARLANENARLKASQPVVREPLTDEQIRAMSKESWVFETVKQWVRITEQLHGITQKGGSNADTATN